jgi:hypothetical protein
VSAELTAALVREDPYAEDCAEKATRLLAEMNAFSCGTLSSVFENFVRRLPCKDPV